MKAVRIALMTLILATPLFAQTATPEINNSWVIDKSHSSATFRVRHLMANSTGKFKDFSADIVLDQAKSEASSVAFTIDAASIDTENENRDKHLRSADFFDVEKFPVITFKSTAIKPKSKTEFDVTGDLTMHGVTRRITLPVQFLGFGKDGRGNPKAGFSIETTLNRKDYGIVWNRNFDDGGVLLGDDVKVAIELELDKKKS